MFTRIIDTLRISSNSNTNNNRYRDIPEINVERRSSTDEGHDATQQSTTTDMPSPTQDTSSPTTPTLGMNRAGAIGIKHRDANDDTVVYPDGRRRSSLFGYSTNAADDYMQKDLLSSSWS